MPYRGKEPMKEKNNHMGGRSGSGTKVNAGPVMRGNTKGNATSSGGINRAVKGR